MSVRSEVLLWAQRVLNRPGSAAYQLLEVTHDASLDEAQQAFHKIARMAHPDLHRSSLTPEELEQVTSAYAKVAGAYQEFRSQRMTTTRMRPIGQQPPPPATAPIAPRPSAAQLVPEAPAASGPTAATSMSSKALIYYRKAEMALRRGELKGAVLQLKMAIAADPQSGFLRSALAEVEAELGKPA